MKANPDVTIPVDTYTDLDIPTKVETGFMAGQEPEIVLSNNFSTTYRWFDTGVIVPLEGYLKDWGLEDKLKEDGLRAYIEPYGGEHLAAFPLEGYLWPWWYNTTILDSAGSDIPKAWDEVIAAAPQIRGAGDEVVAAGNQDSGWYSSMLFLMTTMTHEEYKDWASGSKKLADIPSGVRGVQSWVDARNAGAFPKEMAGLDDASVNEMFYSGKAAIWQGGSWFFSEAPAELMAKVKLGGFPLPSDSAYDKPTLVGGFGAKGVFVTRNGAKVIDAVKRFVQFLYQGKNIARFVEQAGMISPLKDNSDVDQSKLSPAYVQAMGLGDSVTNLGDFEPTPAGVDLGPAGQLMLQPDSTVDQLVAAYDEAYAAGMGQ
jgi:multiple sugar transport system substrate-binding protein